MLADEFLLRLHPGHGPNALEASLTIRPGTSLELKSGGSCAMLVGHRLTFAGAFQLDLGFVQLRCQVLALGHHFAHHRGYVGQRAAARVRPHLLVVRDRDAGGDEGRSSIFNTADGVRGE